ncbi:acyl carrier protein [Pseudomonas sp. CBSPBW29]|jgi:acyl carrier protein|uniref:acyl carrier protein n=1 Tax=Pseudomonas TaxID=286 RepID=UPI0021ACB067|nr:MULTISPECIES: acyl carrier protein [unclassified Pseudomonas]WEL44704.1 acyl carrier protein [Pseudomonas sp. CBSPBW29]WEL65799.1 acyl carrier protein [Pseudomonas sp. CBSPGW29]WEL69268.1 acyl carrier protein [Pseudomonas sp. CBSPCGW29]WEL76258.1 acyl carrier protein [Pseudomonas sp. CBSPAW29]WEL85165.1 acyl carrier protein [Pseudomonas sp. CBSPCAW29]WEL87961.1 acyl carrier protein [Pseudomonas sp. CBSPCBW29]
MSKEILDLIAEAKEADEGSVNLGEQLDWDSIAVVTFMALLSERDISVSADGLNKCDTVDDVVALVAAKSA